MWNGWEQGLLPLEAPETALDFTAWWLSRSMGKRKKSSRKPAGSKKKEPLGTL